MSSGAFLRARAKQAALLTLLIWACDGTNGVAPAPGAGGAGTSGSAGEAAISGLGGDTAGHSGQSGSSGRASNAGMGGSAGTHDHPRPRGGSAGTGGAAGTAGAAGHAGMSGKAGTAGKAGAAGDAGAPGEAGAGGEGGAYTPPECTVVAPTACPDPMPTYADVEPIFTERCVICHMGSADGPWPLNNYGHVSSWSVEIRAMLLDCSMPPPEERTPLPNELSSKILTWIRCGMPP